MLNSPDFSHLFKIYSLFEHLFFCQLQGRNYILFQFFHMDQNTKCIIIFECNDIIINVSEFTSIFPLLTVLIRTLMVPQTTESLSQNQRTSHKPGSQEMKQTKC